MNMELHNLQVTHDHRIYIPCFVEYSFVKQEIIPKKWSFKYLGSISQGDGEINDDVAYCIILFYFLIFFFWGVGGGEGDRNRGTVW